MVKKSKSLFVFSEQTKPEQQPDVVSPPPISLYYNVLIVGEQKSGKSSLLFKYLHPEYEEKTISLDNKKITTSVFEANETGRIPHWRGVPYIVLTLDLTDPLAIEKQDKWLLEISRYANENVKVIIAGTKCDDVQNRHVSQKQIKAMMERQDSNICAYIETSATTGQNVDFVFETAARDFVEVADRCSRQRKEQEEQQQKADQAQRLLKISEGDKRQELKQKLEAYISRIKGDAKNINYSRGFWHHKESRAINREINFPLAKALLKRLNDDEPLSKVFLDIKGQRNQIVGKTKAFMNDNFVKRHNGFFRDTGVNSSELNRIIDNATKFIDRTSTAKSSNNFRAR